MTQSPQNKVPKTFWKSVLSPLTGSDQLELEKSRLEAFLSAFPGEYCGFSSQHNAVYSDKFANMLNLKKIEDVHDIQNCLNAGDAAALEGMFNGLREQGQEFSIDVHSLDGERYFKLSGTKGSAVNGREQFYILWLEDITETKGQVLGLQKNREFAEQELEKFQNMLNAVSIPLWMRNAQSDIIWCNKAYSDLVGETPASVVAQQHELSLTSKNTALKPKALAQKCLIQGAEQTMRAHIIADGNRRFINIAESPLSGTDSTIGMINDLTREEDIDNELQRYVASNKTLLEQLRSAIAIYNADHGLEFYNSAFAQFWGLEDQWLNTGPKLGDILEKLRETRRLPEQADFRNYKKSWLDMFTSLIDPHEDMMYLPDGSALRILVAPHPMGGLMMTFEDVTSRLELESSYNTLIAVQKETLDNLSEGVAVFGGDGRLKLYNPAYTSLWKLNPEVLEGEPHISVLVNKMESLFVPDKWAEAKAVIVSHGIDRHIHEGRLAREDGILLEYTTVPLPDGGVLVSYYDITDSVQVENALREKNAALEAAEQLKTDFLANVSYQLRTPLNAIMGFAEILDNQYFGELNERQKEYTVSIQDAGHKLVDLIDDILDLSTIEAGYLELEMAEFNIQDMLESLQELTEQWAHKQKLTVSVECKDCAGSLIADERRIKQIMLNLIRNAINFTPEKGLIKITATRTDDHMHLAVTDTGVGISKQDQERIFEPFERAYVEKADMSAGALSRGAGLGLSLVKNIAELHGGSVLIDSEENKGTTVTLQLPLKPVLEPLF